MVIPAGEDVAAILSSIERVVVAVEVALAHHLIGAELPVGAESSLAAVPLIARVAAAFHLRGAHAEALAIDAIGAVAAELAAVLHVAVLVLRAAVQVDQPALRRG